MDTNKKRLQTIPQIIKPEVIKWRQDGYPNTTKQTQKLLNHWFKSSHILSTNQPFSFWRCQQEAIETIIYLYEVKNLKKLKNFFNSYNFLLENQFRAFGYDPDKITISQMEAIRQEIKEADFATRYTLSMATGSGKTMVMALAILWLYFNNYSKHYLMVAPNTIVLDRLTLDFGNLEIFSKYDLIPKEWLEDFDLQAIVQGGSETEYKDAILYLTNIQQLYKKQRRQNLNPIQIQLEGIETEDKNQLYYYNTLLDRIAKHKHLAIFHDEAHHSAAKEWDGIIHILHQKNPLELILDASATPKYLDGRPFPHIVYDYPLKEAIDDGIVKDVIVQSYEGLSFGLKSELEQDFFFLEEGLKRLKEFKQKYKDLGIKPVMFVLANDTNHADKVSEYLKSKKELENKVLTIHTNTQGEITIKDLEKARKLAREIDRKDSPYEVIVSVLMLKEGWDVKSVFVTVPLRPSKSELLVEQVMGRGLRRFFPHQKDTGEALFVVYHPSYLDFFEAEIQKRDLAIKVYKKPVKTSHTEVIYPVKEKKQFDIKIPIMAGGLYKSEEIDIDRLKIEKLPSHKLDIEKLKLEAFRTEKKLGGKAKKKHAVELQHISFYNLVLARLVNRIVEQTNIRGVKLKALLEPKVRQYIETRLFANFDNKNKENVKRLSFLNVSQKIIDAFVKEVEKIKQTRIGQDISYKTISLYEVDKIITIKPVYKGQKTVFNLSAYDSELEKDFMLFLDRNYKVLAWCKEPPLKLPYFDSENNLHYYQPDFIVKAKKGNWLIETKGEGFKKQKETEFKADEGKNWVKTASKITKEKWDYLLVDDKNFTSGLDFL